MRTRHRPWGRFLVLAGLALTMVGCDGDLPDRTWTATLEVVVRDQETNRFVEGALVAFANDTIEQTPMATTGEAGLARYRIEMLNGSGVRLDVWRVTRDGYMTWSRPSQAALGADLDEDHPSAQVELLLVPIP